MPDPLAELALIKGCWCHSCHAKLGEYPQFMALCSTCGCKRCPRSTNHEHPCTSSNDSGQQGSVYGVMCAEPCCAAYREFVAGDDA